MAQDIVMPRLSDSMEEGTILRWIKSVGDEVALGDELVEIETDKANMVFEADVAGTLTEIVAQEGDTLPIGEVIARVGEAGETPPAERPVASTTTTEVGVRGPTTTEVARSLRRRRRSRPRLILRRPESKEADVSRRPPSPSAWLASAASTSPALNGSGPGGRIIKADVESAAAAIPAPAPAAAVPARAAGAPAGPTPGAREKPETAKGTTEVVELTKLQQTVARRMAESKATAPHFYLDAEVDMSAAVRGRTALKAAAGEGDVVPSFNDMVVKACALALREFPRANGAYRDGKFELYSRVNVGVAVAAQDALVVPTVFDADLKGLRQIATETRALAARVRDGSVTPPELSGGTFTVSNLGMFGISSFSAVINSPQAGILAVGAIVEKPAVRDGEITTAHLMPVTLACDHRILYGADGAEFLARIRTLLEEPLGLAL